MFALINDSYGQEHWWYSVQLQSSPTIQKARVQMLSFIRKRLQQCVQYIRNFTLNNTTFMYTKRKTSVKLKEASISIMAMVSLSEEFRFCSRYVFYDDCLYCAV